MKTRGIVITFEVEAITDSGLLTLTKRWMGGKTFLFEKVWSTKRSAICIDKWVVRA
jgi:hypothetical protein